MDSWGKSTSIDLNNCNIDIISSKSKIEIYIIEICNLIKMTRYGNPVIHYFGNEPHLSGYSFVQFIETSSITGHFSDNKLSAFIDIFSCTDYDHDLASKFTMNYFESTTMVIDIRNRF